MRISDWSSDVCSSDLQVVGVLDPDRDADEIVGDGERLLAFERDRQVGHRGGVACQRLGAAKAHRQLHDLEIGEKAERLFLAALQIEREGGTSSDAMAAIDRKSTSELQSLMRISFAVFCLKKNTVHDLNLIF